MKRLQGLRSTICDQRVPSTPSSHEDEIKNPRVPGHLSFGECNVSDTGRKSVRPLLSVDQRVGKEPQTSVPPKGHEHICGRSTDFAHFPLAPGSADCDMSRTRHDSGAGPDDHVNTPVDVSSPCPSVGVRHRKDRHRECGPRSRSTDERHVVEQAGFSRVLSRSASFPADSKSMLMKAVAFSSDGTVSSLLPACKPFAAGQTPTTSANDKSSHNHSFPVI